MLFQLSTHFLYFYAGKFLLNCFFRKLSMSFRNCAHCDLLWMWRCLASIMSLKLTSHVAAGLRVSYIRHVAIISIRAGSLIKLPCYEKATLITPILQNQKPIFCFPSVFIIFTPPHETPSSLPITTHNILYHYFQHQLINE